jgi:hypothetical protein
MRLLPILLLLTACADDPCNITTTRYWTTDLLTGQRTSMLCQDTICPNDNTVRRSCRAD